MGSLNRGRAQPFVGERGVEAFQVLGLQPVVPDARA
jgi:hypothetical protein